MPKFAVLLIDLQVDFLTSGEARMPVMRSDAERVVAAVDNVLDGSILRSAIPVLSVNQFSRSALIGTFLRHNAKIVGTTGAALDSRIRRCSDEVVFAKSAPSAFSNPELDRYLQERSVQSLFVFGVFAEGCVRATVLDAKRRGYDVTVPKDAIFTNANWKRKYAIWFSAE
jgi:nicotinamidase-related amidase